MSDKTEKPKKVLVKLNQYDRPGKGRELINVIEVTKGEAEIILSNPAQAKLHSLNTGEKAGEPQTRSIDPSEVDELKSNYEEALSANEALKAKADEDAQKAEEASKVANEAINEAAIAKQQAEEAQTEAEAVKAENETLRKQLDAIQAENIVKGKGGKKGDDAPAGDNSNAKS